MVIKEISNQNCKHLSQTPPECDHPETLSPATALGVRSCHRQLPGYRPTPLVRLEHLVRVWGFKDIFIKDEASRFGLNAFKVLGGSYAVARLVRGSGYRLEKIHRSAPID
jgi:threonine dehydratase